MRVPGIHGGGSQVLAAAPVDEEEADPLLVIMLIQLLLLCQYRYVGRSEHVWPTGRVAMHGVRGHALGSRYQA